MKIQCGCCANYDDRCVTLADIPPKMEYKAKEVLVMKSMRKSRKYIFGMVTIGLFGMAGLLLVPVAICIVKIINRYPRVFGWIFLTVCAFICIYGVLFKREWDTSFVLIMCSGVIIAVSSILNTDRR